MILKANSTFVFFVFSHHKIQKKKKSAQLREYMYSYVCIIMIIVYQKYFLLILNNIPSQKPTVRDLCQLKNNKNQEVK